MIEVTVKDGWYFIRGTKMTLALSRRDFIAALKRAKAMQRQEALAQRLQAAADPRREPR